MLRVKSASCNRTRESGWVEIKQNKTSLALKNDILNPQKPIFNYKWNMPDLPCYCMTSWCQLSYNYTLEDRSLSYRGDLRSPSPPPASLHEAKKKKARCCDPSSKYKHWRSSALLRNIRNIRICMRKKPIVSVTYENERLQ